MSTDLCRLTSIILKIDAPFPAAEVRKPARREWPENALASNPARLAYALTMLATDHLPSGVVDAARFDL